MLDRDEILARCRDALAEQEKLRSQNQHLQHKLAEYLAYKKVSIGQVLLQPIITTANVGR